MSVKSKEQARVPSQRAKEGSQPVSPLKPLYLIWSTEHHRWWRPLECGYTSDDREAGRYDRVAAMLIVAQASWGWGDRPMPPEVAIVCPPIDVLESRDAPQILAKLVAQEQARRSAARAECRRCDGTGRRMENGRGVADVYLVVCDCIGVAP